MITDTCANNSVMNCFVGNFLLKKLDAQSKCLFYVSPLIIRDAQH